MKGSVLHKTALTSDASYTSGVPRPPASLTDWLQIWGFHNPCRFGNSLGQLTEFRKTLCLLLTFYYKGHKSGPVKWRATEGKVWEGPKHTASVPSPYGIRVHYPPDVNVFTNQEAPLSTDVQSFIGISLHTESLATRLNSISSHQHPLPKSGDWADSTWPKAPTH